MSLTYDGNTARCDLLPCCWRPLSCDRGILFLVDFWVRDSVLYPLIIRVKVFDGIIALRDVLIPASI